MSKFARKSPAKPQSVKPTYYAVLGLQPGCTDADVHRAFRVLAVNVHPDSLLQLAKNRKIHLQCAFEGARPDVCPVCKAAQKLREYTEAFAVLKTAKMRKLYDAQQRAVNGPCERCGGSGRLTVGFSKTKNCGECNGSGQKTKAKD